MRRLIRFRRLGSEVGEIAFDEADLRRKLGGDQAEVWMPAKPWWVRLWRRWRPLRGVGGAVGSSGRGGPA